MALNGLEKHRDKSEMGRQEEARQTNTHKTLTGIISLVTPNYTVAMLRVTSMFALACDLWEMRC